jgi:hypothetical protein
VVAVAVQSALFGIVVAVAVQSAFFLEMHHKVLYGHSELAKPSMNY